MSTPISKLGIHFFLGGGDDPFLVVPGLA
jgi:hypothetical protein